MKIIEPKTKEDFAKYYDLRWRILRKPWGQPAGREMDDLEDESIHLMACQVGGGVCGVVRAHFNSPGEAQIRYMAVDDRYQGKGIGSKLLAEIEKRIKAKGGRRVVLNARELAIGFYEERGYDIVGKSHTLYGSIEHFKMQKRLSFPVG
ncbi:MAG: GNAT family N-acetyltransferase [Planctomycetes bacterium]|nr:GNAT family N-acetyltransferase [Planctomycetota bacterium]